MTATTTHLVIAMALAAACAAPVFADNPTPELASNTRYTIDAPPDPAPVDHDVDDDQSVARARAIIAALDQREKAAADSRADAEPDPPTEPSLLHALLAPAGDSGAATTLAPLDLSSEELPLGQNPTTANAEQTADIGPSGSWILQTLSALGVVIALILLIRFVFLRMSGQPRFSDARGVVKVLGRAPIGPRAHVMFLRINQRVIVVGQTPAGLNTLTELDDPHDVAWLIERVESNRTGSVTEGFKHLLNRMDRDYHPDADLSDEGNDETEYVVDRTRDGISGLLSRIRSSGTDRDREDRP